MLKTGQSAELVVGRNHTSGQRCVLQKRNHPIIKQFAQLRNLSHVNCAVSNAHNSNVCACRTMKTPPHRATMAACGCNNLGADTLHLLQRAPGNGGSAELQSQLGSGLCSISTLHTYLLLVPPFPLSSGARHLTRWRGLLPSSYVSQLDQSQLYC